YLFPIKFGWIALASIIVAIVIMLSADAARDKWMSRRAKRPLPSWVYRLPDRPMSSEEKLRLIKNVIKGRQIAVAEVNLTDAPSEEHEPAIARTGDWIAFSSNGLDTDGDGKLDATGQDFNIWIMRRDGTQLRMVTVDAQGNPEAGNQVQPTWSPGAQEIAYISDETGAPELFILNLTTGEKRMLPVGRGVKRDPFWASDGKIYFAYAPRGQLDIYAITPGGTLSGPLTTDPADDYCPRVSPDGTRIVFVSKRQTPSNPNRRARIWIMNIDGTNPMQITTYPDPPGRAVDDIDPAWHPTGTEIAFASSRPITQDDPAQDRFSDFNIYRLTIRDFQGQLIPEDPPPPYGTGANQARLLTNRDPRDRADDIQPCYHPLPQRFPGLYCVSKRTGNNDIWRISIQDITPPFLEGLPSITPRLAQPGSTVKIEVIVSDLESGVRRVRALFNDPDTPNTDAEGVNHKPFVIITDIDSNAWLNVDNTGEIQTLAHEIHPREYPTPFQAPGFSIIDPSPAGQVDLQVYDDGPVSRGGHEPEGSRANDGIYYCVGEWQTPVVPSDYLVDIQVEDNAGNQFTWDNIWGFSTEPFTPDNPILLVSDYMQGQRFLAGWFVYEYGGVPHLPPVFVRWLAASTPTESYYLWNPSGVENGADIETVRGASWWGEVEALPDPGVDVWRIQCRGPVPSHILAAYLPRKDVQLNPANLSELQEVPVAERCVIWVSPYTGDLVVGSGTLWDAATQATIASFIDQGGRIAIIGNDIAWALSNNGAVVNPFLRNYLHAEYVGEPFYSATFTQYMPVPGIFPTLSAWIIWIRGGTDTLNIDETRADPITREPAVGSWGDGHTPTELNTSLQLGGPPFHNDAALMFRWLPQDVEGNIYGLWYGHETTMLADVIRPDSAAVAVYRYDEGLPAGQDTAALRFEDTSTGARVVYFAFDLALVCRCYHGTGPHCRNLRSHLFHNIICWLRSGQIIGKVVDNITSKPLPQTIVEALDPGSGQTVRAVLTLQDGSYEINGLPPGRYSLRATKTGYFTHEFSNIQGVAVHGGMRMPSAGAINFRLVPAPPGSISGHVYQSDGTTPIPNATVTATSVVPGVDGEPVVESATTDVNGAYTIPDLPAGLYNVTATAEGYMSVTKTDVRVDPGADTSDVDFNLPAEPGTVEGMVVREDNGRPIANAKVDALQGGMVVASTTTAANGTYRLEQVPGGETEIRASAPGFATRSRTVTVIPGETLRNVDLQLPPLPPGSISGLVVRLVDSTPVGDVQVEVVDATGSVVASEVTSAQVTEENGYCYNYRISDVPAGTYTVQVTTPGYTADPQTNVTVTAGRETKGINFYLRALKTFKPGLHMMSVPFDYTRERLSADEILGITNPKLATWVTDPSELPYRGHYVFYPTKPADSFYTGRGYFFLTTESLDFTREGAPIYPGQPFVIELQEGWNLIGTPFNFRVDWLKTQVR
ncbi:MAG TPA: hypothetical protein EYP10_08405, partial [Armatimonadetes bacterium]|nr:hypothetical protein [Armatimonadota bacterium]